MHLAQLNISKTKFPLSAPEMKALADNIDPIDALAESSKGFVWRFQDKTIDTTTFDVLDDPNRIINMSVWESVKDLKEFMFRTVHRDFLRRKREWFHTESEATYVLWWVPVGCIPTLDEAVERLMYLRENGDSPYAFTLKSKFQTD